MDQPRGDPGVLGAAGDLQRLSQGVGDHPGVFGGGDPPAQNPAGEDVDDERDIDEPGQRLSPRLLISIISCRCGSSWSTAAANNHWGAPRRTVSPPTRRRCLRCRRPPDGIHAAAAA
jgi:hypothetical protein